MAAGVGWKGRAGNVSRSRKRLLAMLSDAELVLYHSLGGDAGEYGRGLVTDAVEAERVTWQAAVREQAEYDAATVERRRAKDRERYRRNVEKRKAAARVRRAA